jgi:8-amino-7-oxononanoate synthase
MTMATEAHTLARQMLARHGRSGGPSVDEARSVSLTEAAGRRVRRSDLADHPQIAEAMRIRSHINSEFIARGMPNPYFLAHTGANCATVELLGREMINFSSYNYLGLAGDPRVIAAAKEALDTYGTSASASRAVAGEIPLFAELERRLADAYGVDDAVVTPSGFLTNAGIIAFILGREDLAVCDSLVHNSIVSGTQWSECRRASFAHNDPDALDRLLRRSRGHFERVMVILEGVYSMDGDIAHLPELIEVARRHECLVMVDEAHSFGTLEPRGLGIREFFDLPGDAVDIWMGTLSKSMASSGGYLAGDEKLIWAIKLLAPGICLFTAPQTPPQVAAAIAALDLMLEEPDRLARLRANADAALSAAKSAGWDTGASAGTAIIPIILGDSARTVAASVELLAAGINASAVAYPAVPEGEARLRLFISAEHTAEHIDRVVAALAKIATPS